MEFENISGLFDEDYYRIDYSFTSFLNNTFMGEEPADFVNEFSLSIFQMNDAKKQDQLIGRGAVTFLQLDRAIDFDFPLFDIFDMSDGIMEMANAVFDLENEEDYWSKLDSFFEYDLPTSYDTCFIEWIELLPEYRGKGIGKWVIKNILERFYGSTGLVVLRAFPLQHAADPDLDSEWHKKMRYDLLEQDLEQAQYKLFHYFQQLGFSNPFDQEYFLVRPEEFNYDQFWSEGELPD